MSSTTRPPSILFSRGARVVCLAAMAVSPLVPRAAPQTEWVVAPYFYYVHAVSTGQPELAMAQFAADAVVVAGPHCTADAPCRGHAAIRTGFLLPGLALGLRPPAIDQRFDGAWLQARGDGMPGAVEAPGLGGLSGIYSFELRHGRIVTLRFDAHAKRATSVRNE